MTLIEFHTRMTGFVDIVEGTLGAILRHLAAPDGRYLSAPEEAVAHRAIPHRDKGAVDTTVVDVSTAEHATAVLQTVQADVVGPRLVVDLLLVLPRLCVVDIAHIAIVELDVR